MYASISIEIFEVAYTFQTFVDETKDDDDGDRSTLLRQTMRYI